MPGLNSLPAELFGKISDHLDDRTLHALRSASKDIEKKTFDPFADRAYKWLTVPLTPQGLLNALADLQNFGDDQSRRVKIVEFQDVDVDTATSYVENQGTPQQDHDAVFTLTVQLLRKLTNFNSMLIVGKDIGSTRVPPRSAMSKLLRALIATGPLLKLHRIEIEGGHYRVNRLQELLATQKNTLSIFRVVDANCHVANSWLDLMQTIREECSLLKSLFVSGLRSGFARHYIYPARLGHVVRDVPSEDEEDGIQKYLLYHSWVSMQGMRGVNAGINRMLRDQGL